MLLAACSKQSLQTTYDKQITYIESIIQGFFNRDPHATLVKGEEGVYRINLHDTLDVHLHRTDSLEWGGEVSLYYACFILTSASLTNTNLVATNLKELAEQAKWNLTDPSVFKLDTLKLDNNLVPGLAQGLKGVQPLDEGYILFTGKYGYGKNERGTIPARSALAYYFWIENINNEN
jgi:hypothetical protein